jgi:hypothetical protein
MGHPKNKGGMGFRDLVIFNQDLLAKQFWRLLQIPSSLTARIIKAKYYPHSSIMEASLRNRPYFAWRSIPSSRTLLQQGMVWRVGDGRSIQVLGDRWLPTPISFFVQSPRWILDENATVADLIDQNTKGCKTKLIREVFHMEEAQVTSNIPLSSLQPQDQMIWSGTTNGIFSVCSTYHLKKEI